MSNTPTSNAFTAKVHDQDFGIFINLNVLPGQHEMRSVYKAGDTWEHLHSEFLDNSLINTAEKADSAMNNALLNINAQIADKLSGGAGGDKPASGIERIQWSIENSFYIDNNLVNINP